MAGSNYLAVAKECRKRGFGRRLMDEAEARLRAIGCPKINLQIRELERRVRRVLPLARVFRGRRREHGQAPGTGLTRIAPGPVSSSACRNQRLYCAKVSRCTGQI